jgi:tRNA threonylcarbamoyladenosine biosynthesis protein TsaE
MVVLIQSSSLSVIPAKAGIHLPFKNLIHIDAYRLEKAHELEVLGFKELLKDQGNLIVLEWPERVSDILPSDLSKIYFKFISENEREIEI